MAGKPIWVVVGGETLLGKEVREVVAEQRLPIRLEAASTGAKDRVLTEDEGELGVMEPLTAETLAGAEAVLLAGDAVSQRKALELLAGLGEKPAIVDLTGASEGLPNARLGAPLLSGAEGFAKGPVWVVPHAAALILGRILGVIAARFSLKRVVVTLMEPASAHGHPGVEELQKQTISLLSFGSLPKDVFDAQVSFNLLPRFGDEAKASLARSSERLERHLGAMLGPKKVPVPSVRLVHAPVFHGYGGQVWMEFESRPEVAQVEESLREAGVDVRSDSVEPPSNLGVAGQSGISAGEISADHNDVRGMWMWLAADNLRIVAENALLVAGLAVRGQ